MSSDDVFSESERAAAVTSVLLRLGILRKNGAAVTMPEILPAQ